MSVYKNFRKLNEKYISKFYKGLNYICNIDLQYK